MCNVQQSMVCHTGKIPIQKHYIFVYYLLFATASATGEKTKSQITDPCACRVIQSLRARFVPFFEVRTSHKTVKPYRH